MCLEKEGMKVTGRMECFEGSINRCRLIQKSVTLQGQGLCSFIATHSDLHFGDCLALG